MVQQSCSWVLNELICKRMCVKNQEAILHWFTNCLELETVTMSSNRWMNKQSVPQPYKGILFSNTKKWASSCTETGINPRYLLQSEISPSAKATYCMIPFIWYSGKGKTIKTLKIQWLFRGWDEAGGLEEELQWPWRKTGRCRVYFGCGLECENEGWRMTFQLSASMTVGMVTIDRDD